MSGSTTGHRHSKPPQARRSGLAGVRGVVVLVAVVAAAAVLLALTWWLTHDSSQSSPPATTAPSDSSSVSTSPSESAATTSTVTTTRTVSVNGAIVTVEERSEVSGGDSQAVPVSGTPLGLTLVDLVTVADDGRSSAFDAPLSLSSSGSLTTRGRYRITDCPDLLPPAWPSPVEFEGSTQTYLRVEEPLHTAHALCPDARSHAESLGGLSAVLDPGDNGTAAGPGIPTVRLRWDGAQQLDIIDVGSASGVAALPVELGCDGDCVAELPPGGSATITLQPVDPCPPATDDDTLTLKRGGGDVVSVIVKGLHRSVCGQ